MLRLGIVSVELLALLGSVAHPPPSSDPWSNVDCNQNAGPGCDVSVGTGGTHGGSGAAPAVGGTGSSGDDGLSCRYVPVDYQDPRRPPGEGGWYMVLCSPDGKDPLSHGPVWIAGGAAGLPALSPAQVAQMARKRLRLPDIRIAASPAGDQLVNLPTWLWLREGWRDISATASVPGVSVTAVARPKFVSWSMGDEAVVSCSGPGMAFPDGADPRSPSPVCGHTYRRSSAGQADQAYQVVATVHWSVTWSGASQDGSFPELTTTSSATFRVVEAQALNSSR